MTWAPFKDQLESLLIDVAVVAEAVVFVSLEGSADLAGASLNCDEPCEFLFDTGSARCR